MNDSITWSLRAAADAACFFWKPFALWRLENGTNVIELYLVCQLFINAGKTDVLAWGESLRNAHRTIVYTGMEDLEILNMNL